MFYQPLRYISLGAGIVVCASRILTVVSLDTHFGKIMLRKARATSKILDARSGKPGKSVLVLDNGDYIVSNLPLISVFRILVSDVNTFLPFPKKKGGMSSRLVEAIEREGILLITDDDGEIVMGKLKKEKEGEKE